MNNLYCKLCDSYVTTMSEEDSEFLTVTCEECW
jgi:translation initiation factor 2 beta subunit (eIF-2beta)/eIF-5